MYFGYFDFIFVSIFLSTVLTHNLNGWYSKLTFHLCSHGCGTRPKPEWTGMQRTYHHQGSLSPAENKRISKTNWCKVRSTFRLRNPERPSKNLLTAVETWTVGGPETTDWHRLCNAPRIAGTKSLAALFWNIFRIAIF